MQPTIGVVVLSMGNRPRELARALDTLLEQRGVTLDVLVVGNGWQPEGLPEGVRALHLPENVGIPEGRNIGARNTTGEFIFVYDDDAELPDPDTLSKLVAVVRSDPRNALAQPRGADPQGRPSPRRWVPRLRVSDDGRGRAGEAAVFWEAVFVIRREAFDGVGGWPGHFWYGHEGIDLAFRLLDAGWKIQYVPSVEIYHPATTPARHAVYYRMNARNRVWVAKRNLPWPLAIAYLVVWTLLSIVRIRGIANLRTWFRGFWEGWRGDPGERNPISWSTAWRMTRLGRPPVL